MTRNPEDYCLLRWSGDCYELLAGMPRASAQTRGVGQDARVYARDLRLTLAREHIDRPAPTTRSGCFYDPEGCPPALLRSSAF
jgi:hypothetical protein